MKLFVNSLSDPFELMIMCVRFIRLFLCWYELLVKENTKIPNNRLNGVKVTLLTSIYDTQCEKCGVILVVCN